MKVTLKVGQSEVNLSGWNLVFMAIAGFGLIAPGPATSLLAGIESRLRGAGSAATSWFFDPRRNPAGGPPLPSRWSDILGGFEQIRSRLFWIYMIEMALLFIFYVGVSFIPYGGGIVCLVMILMALTPWAIFMFFGGEFLLPGLEALGQLMPSQVRAQAGGAVEALKRGLIRTMIPISILYLLLGIMAIFLSPPIMPRPGIGFLARSAVFALFLLAGALYIITGRLFFRTFAVLIVGGTVITVVGTHSWWRAPNMREKALDTANLKKLSDEAGLIHKLNFRKAYQSMPFWKEIQPAPNRIVSFETLPTGVVMEVGDISPYLPTGVQLLTKTTRQAAFWRVDRTTGNAELESLPAGTELGLIYQNATIPAGFAGTGPILEVRRRDDPSVQGFVQAIDTDYGVVHLAGPVAEVWMRSDPRVRGFVSVADMDARTDPWEDQPDGPPWWRRAWGYVGGPRPPDPVPTRLYSPPSATGTRGVPAGNQGTTPFVHGVTITILAGTGSWPVPVDGFSHELPGLKCPAEGVKKYFAITGPTGVRVLPMFKDAAGALQPFGAPWILTTGHRYGVVGASGSVGTIHVKAW